MPQRFHSSSESSPHEKVSKDKKNNKGQDKKPKKSDKKDKKPKKEKKPKKSKKQKNDEDEDEGTDDCNEPLGGGGNDDDEDDDGMFEELEGIDGLLDVPETSETKKRPASTNKTRQSMKRPSKKGDDDLKNLEAWRLQFAKLNVFS